MPIVLLTFRLIKFMRPVQSRELLITIPKNLLVSTMLDYLKTMHQNIRNNR